MRAPKAKALSAHFTVLNLGARGQGQADAPPGHYTLEQMADDACGLLAHPGVARSHWLGLSVGGTTGQVMALRHLEVLDRLVRVDASHLPNLDRRMRSSRLYWTFCLPRPKAEGALTHQARELRVQHLLHQCQCRWRARVSPRGQHQQAVQLHA